METKLANCEVRPQVIWPVSKFLTETGGTKSPSAIHGPLGPIFYPIDKASIIADCLENQLKEHDLCDFLQQKICGGPSRSPVGYRR
jgi:hypothetical protein